MEFPVILGEGYIPDQGSSHGGVGLRSKNSCGFSDHVNNILPQKGGGGGRSPLFPA